MLYAKARAQQDVYRLISVCILWQTRNSRYIEQVPNLTVFPALIVHSELKSVHPGFPVAFIFKHKLINK